MGDFFVDDGGVLAQFPEFSFCFGPHFVGSFEGVVEALLHFLGEGRGTSPSVLV